MRHPGDQLSVKREDHTGINKDVTMAIYARIYIKHTIHTYTQGLYFKYRYGGPECCTFRIKTAVVKNSVLDIAITRIEHHVDVMSKHVCKYLAMSTVWREAPDKHYHMT